MSSNDSWKARPFNKNIFTVSLINARSLHKKLDSLGNILNELTADLCLLTETWFKENRQINASLEDFINKTCYGLLRKDRGGPRRGGGVAICFNKDKLQMTKAKIPPSKHEVYTAVGRRVGQRRKVVALVVYIPPWYNFQQNQSLFDYVNDAILALKSKYENPYLIVGGDFNRRSFAAATAEAPEIKPILTGPTHGNATLDILTSNVNHMLVDQGTVRPVYTRGGEESDHMTVFAQIRMPKEVPSYAVEKYSYFHLTEEGDQEFGRWLEKQDWTDLLNLTDPDKMAEEHACFWLSMSSSYTFRTRTKRSSEPA